MVIAAAYGASGVFYGSSEEMGEREHHRASPRWDYSYGSTVSEDRGQFRSQRDVRHVENRKWYTRSLDFIGIEGVCTTCTTIFKANVCACVRALFFIFNIITL